MRKLLIIASLFFAGATVQAQDFKPQAGSVTTDFGLYGGISDSELDLNEGILRFRYFAKENLAYRLGFGAGVYNNVDKVYGADGEEGSRTYTDNSLTINLGIEKHFAGTNRLSPYVGADLLFGTSKETTKDENYLNGAYSATNNTEFKGPGDISFGLRGVIGADYYIAKHLFLGAEAGLGLTYTVEGKQKTDINGVTTEYKSAGNSLNLGQGLVTAIRIGFVF